MVRSAPGWWRIENVGPIAYDCLRRVFAVGYRSNPHASVPGTVFADFRIDDDLQPEAAEAAAAVAAVETPAAVEPAAGQAALLSGQLAAS